MKNSLKMGLLASVIAVSVSACGDPSKGKSTQTTIDTPAKNIDTTSKVAIDTAKKDTTKK